MAHQILVVEDDPDTRAGLCDVLQLHDYETSTAGTVEEAINHPSLAEFSFILLDRRLPDGTAEELLPQLRRLAPDASVVIVTGQSDVEGTIHALKHGASDFMLKPIDPVQLDQNLRRIAKIKAAEKNAEQTARLAVIGQAIAAFTHESRNAIHRGNVCLELLELEIEDRPEAVELAQQIRGAHDDLHSLFEEVREFAAPMVLETHEDCLREIAQQAWNERLANHPTRSLNLSIESDGHDTRCPVDEFRLRQVFGNLFENSIAAGDDPVEIVVRFDQIDDVSDGKAICATVTDNGPGLSDEQCDKLFDPFYTTKRLGTGLGLAIIKPIIESHAGKIRFDSSYKLGARFVLQFPVQRPTENEVDGTTTGPQ